jgi:hypothetical protein
MRDLLGPLGAWDHEFNIPTGNVEVIVGGFPVGMDLIVRNWCFAYLVACQVYQTSFDRYGDMAIRRRNAQMVAANPLVCLGFPEPGLRPGARSGTIDLMEMADAAGIPVRYCTPHDK